MTRFARAKGSKASNERVPEQATPWSEMKHQLDQKKQEVKDNVKRQEAEKLREKNYKAFLEEVEEEKVRNSEWADFPIKNPVKNAKAKEPNNVVKKNNTGDSKVVPLKGIKGNKEKKDLQKTAKVNVVPTAPINSKKESASAEGKEQNTEKKQEEAKKKKRKTKLKTNGDTPNSVPKQNNKAEKTENQKNEKSRKRKVEQQTDSDTPVKKLHSNEEVKNLTPEEREKIKLAKLEKKKQNRRMKMKQKREARKLAKKEPQTEEEKKKVEKKKEKKIRQLEKKKLGKLQNQTPDKKNKELKPRRKYPENSMIINGKEVPVEYVDGFPIKKEDAERIHQLRKQMISKGLPRSEIKIALKLERRKAEKAFTRERKKVCFNCRKSGHNLSECPEIGNQVAETTGTGICFKCGSTEHTHFECKVVRGEEFKFASCFICHEQGHIARQCPDNARGLYPKGGACNVCGDVTHLKKDCPKYQAQQQQLQNIQVETISADDNPDSLTRNDAFVNKNLNRRPNKVVKFSLCFNLYTYYNKSHNIAKVNLPNSSLSLSSCWI